MFTDGLQIWLDMNQHTLQEDSTQMRIQVAVMRPDSGSATPVLLPGQVSFAT